jgi:hypothetical protein
MSPLADICRVLSLFFVLAIADNAASLGADRATLSAGPYRLSAFASPEPASEISSTIAAAATVPGQAPSLIQRLEGREGDLMLWISIAAIFFLAGWLGGSIHSRRRERSRRGRLRF